MSEWQLSSNRIITVNCQSDVVCCKLNSSDTLHGLGGKRPSAGSWSSSIWGDRYPLPAAWFARSFWLIDWLVDWLIHRLIDSKIVIHVPVSGFGCWPLMNYLWIIVWCLSVFSLRSALQVPCLTWFFFDSSVRWLHFKENFIVKSYFPNWQERGSLFALEGWPRSSSGVVDARMQWLTPWTWLHFVI